MKETLIKNKKTWTIPVSWEECGVIKVEAESLEAALKIAEDPYGEIALPEGNYVDASWKVSDLDTEAIRALYNEGQKDCNEDSEVKCMYCGATANNATSKEGLMVCCCYMLHKKGNTYTQYHEDKGPTTFSANEGSDE